MKQTSYIIISLLLLFSSAANCFYYTDTIVVKIGDSSQIFFSIHSKKDLQKIREQNINEILENSIDSTDIQSVEKDIILDDTEQKSHGNRNRKGRNNFSIIKKELSNGKKHITIDFNRKVRINIVGDSWEEAEKELDKIYKLMRKRIHWKHWYSKLNSMEEKKYDHSFYFDFGMNNWIQPNGTLPQSTGEHYSVRPWGSWYIGFTSTHSHKIKGPLYFEWGIGFSWYNWKFEDPSTQIMKRDHDILFYQGNQNNEWIKSDLAATYIHASFVPVIHLGNTQKHSKQRYRIGFGGYIAYRIQSHSKTIKKVDGHELTDLHGSDFYLSNFRYGLRGQMGWRRLDFFVNYDLNPVFYVDTGPKLNTISFGITIHVF